MKEARDFKLVTGKNGTTWLRRKDSGDSLAILQWNTQTGEPEKDNAFVERVYHLLRLAQDIPTETLARLDDWHEWTM